MTRPAINRRQALSLFGGAGLGAVALGACTSANDKPAAGSSASAVPATTSNGATSTASSAAAVAGTDVTVAMFGGAASCTVTPEQTEGPYYIDVDKIRADIREDRQGTPLRVATRVVDKDGCTPIKDAIFEIWHCDAGGLYSGFEAASQGGGGGARDDKRYLRGAQTTNADGIAVITTIYPGWYRGRTVHIHAKIALSNTELLTTQFYFDEDTTAKVYTAAPYSSHTGRDTMNDDDGIYRKETTLTVTPDGSGYLGLITVGVDA
jgi:protocatechuate 3,4-dioxygenase beta subunit